MSERVNRDRAYYREYNKSHLDTRPDIDIQWYFDRVEELERQLEQAGEALEKAAATFGDLQQASDILGRTLVAESCRIAKEATLNTLATLRPLNAAKTRTNQEA